MTVTYDLTPLNGILGDEITLTYDASSEPEYKLAIWWINYNEETDGNKTYSNSFNDDKRLATATSTSTNGTIQITQKLLDTDIKTISLFYIQTGTSSARFTTPLSEATLLKTWNVHYEKTNLYYKLRTLGNQWFYTKPEIDKGTITPTNKNLITTSFTPAKLITNDLQYTATITNKGNSISFAENDGIKFTFSCNTNEYYQFNVVVATDALSLYSDAFEFQYKHSLSVGTHNVKVTEDKLIIDNTTIDDDFDGKLVLRNDTTSNVELTLSNKQWYHEATFFDKIYPIGSVHITTNSVNPSNYFDGEWERIRDTFLLASGTTYENGATGGSAEVKLTASQSGVPAHNHTYAHSDTTYKLNTTNRKPGTSTAVAYGTSITATANNTTKTSNDNTAQNASEAHNNMPPYLAVYMWERVG